MLKKIAKKNTMLQVCNAKCADHYCFYFDKTREKLYYMKLFFARRNRMPN